MPEVLERVTKEWGESLRRAALELGDDPAEARDVLLVASVLARILAESWLEFKGSAKGAGVSKPKALGTCAALLHVAGMADEALARVEAFARQESQEASALREPARAVREPLDALAGELRRFQAFLERPSRFSVTAEELNRLVAETDQEGRWVPLRDAIERRKRGRPEGQP